jgi:hypothetical protein
MSWSFESPVPPAVVCSECYRTKYSSQCKCASKEYTKAKAVVEDTLARVRVDLGVEILLNPYGHGIVVSYVAGSKPTRWEVKLDDGRSVFAEADSMLPWFPSARPTIDHSRTLQAYVTQEDLLKYYTIKLHKRNG